MSETKGTRSGHVLALCAVFFLSGASALVFETLWFRLAGLAFGNGVWASALVLSSFMAGLALGNGLAARFGARIRRPVRMYAIVELVVAIVGVALVAGMPALTELLAPLFEPLLDTPVVLNVVRLSISFTLLMIPATAMGMTLPLLVKALYRAQGSFGKAIGLLYGWNTLGAVAGALVGEAFLLERFGVLGTSFWAAAFNVLAVLGAFAIAGGLEGGADETPAERSERPKLTPRARRMLVASFLSGGILLALEVVWFRFLQLFLPGTTLTFAIMLSIVLAGIGLGGLLASIWLRFSSTAYRRAGALALLAGIAAVYVYTYFEKLSAGVTESRVLGYGLEGLDLCFGLLFPVSLLSGVLFTTIGDAVHKELPDETRAAGLVTMANTIGATLGPLVAGFALIPSLGMERSFFVLALAYAVVALLLIDFRAWRSPARAAIEGGLAIALGFVASTFPFGRMEHYISVASAGYRTDGSKVIAVREGLIETIQYLEKQFLGEPQFYRLVTNGYSMSGTHAAAMRYMKAYVYWPVAVHPGLKSACLISFGTGSTAKALTDTASLETIDVVDISREILEMADTVFPERGSNPLLDPRVATHVEDGRFFLQTTEKRFDLITSEPPPPKAAGVVNLYTKEYFQLIYDRLAEGGVCTYWLPVVQLEEPETRAVIRAFVDVFGDEATLWSGCGLDWMLIGTRNATGPVSDEHFLAQWKDPVVGPELHALGFEEPGQLGATFMMGADEMRARTADTPPLTDGHPKRLSARLGMDLDHVKLHAEYMDTKNARRRFEASEYVARVFPASIREASLAHFETQELLNRITIPPGSNDQDFGMLHKLVTKTNLRMPILWAHGSTASIERILDRMAETDADTLATDHRALYHQALRAIADRELARAEDLLRRSQEVRANPRHTLTRVYLMALDDRGDEARALIAASPDVFKSKGARAFLTWLAQVTSFRE